MRNTISAMRVCEAKDFLVRQIFEQAEIDGISLSDIEIKMLYFPEVEDPTRTCEEFKTHQSLEDFERKISRLLDNAYTRNKKTNPQTAEEWQSVIDVLSKGDHYLVWLWGCTKSKRIPPMILMRVFAKLAFLIAIVTVVALGMNSLARYFGVPISYFVFSFIAVVLLISWIRPAAAARLTKRTILSIILFLFGRKRSHPSV